jgi:hypothetical protein
VLAALVKNELAYATDVVYSVLWRKLNQARRVIV